MHNYVTELDGLLLMNPFAEVHPRQLSCSSGRLERRIQVRGAERAMSNKDRVAHDRAPQPSPASSIPKYACPPLNTRHGGFRLETYVQRSPLPTGP